LRSQAEEVGALERTVDKLHTRVRLLGRDLKMPIKQV
jgi:hypothetical protein